jgi:hypothetical protein
MTYELFTKKKERKRRTHTEKPLMVTMEKSGRLMINQGFFPMLMANHFEKTEIFIDYQNQKIGLKMLTEEVKATDAKKIIKRPQRTRLTFISFVAVKTKLNLEYPFVRNATWDDKNKMIEFSFKEEKNA